MGQAIRTTDHDTIRHWIEEHGGRPARVAQSTKSRGNKSRGAKQQGGGILRVDFGEKEESLEEISWDTFFDIFEDRSLAFLYQEESGKGGDSRFNKFVSRKSDSDA
jgi:hypothetical protein